MKTIIVPVDFSETATNAAKYAVHLGHQMGVQKVVLYHTYGGSYQILEKGADLVYNETHVALQHLAEVLQPLAPDQMEFELIAGDSFLLDDLRILVEKKKAMLIVMGITGKNIIEQKLIGSNTLRVASDSPCPVLVIPANVTYTAVEKVVLSIKSKAGIPYSHIKDIVTQLGAKMGILSIAEEDLHDPSQQISDAFEDLKPDVKVVKDAHNIPKTVNEYIVAQHAQILMSVTRKTSFFESFFKSTVTQQLAFHAQVPLLVFRALKS